MIEHFDVEICDGVDYRHKITGKPLHMVPERCKWTTEDDDGDVFEHEFESKRPAKWYKPENVEIVRRNPVKYYVPLFKEA